MKIEILASCIIPWLFLIGIIHMRSGYSHPAGLSGTPNDSFSQARSESGLEQYRFIKGGKGVTKEGITTSYAVYESSDGIMIFVTTEFFKSNARMKTQFEAKRKGFPEIVEAGEVTDMQGNVKGERIVGKRSADEPEIRRYVIIWSEDYKIKNIESNSLVKLLDFEKRFYR